MTDQNFFDLYFADMLNMPGLQLRMRPELPKFVVKRNGAKYTITDLRLLNESAVNTLLQIVRIAANDRETEIAFAVPCDVTDKQLETTVDIVTGITIETKRGKSTFEMNSIVASATTKHLENGARTITFNVVKSFADYAYRKAHEGEMKVINFYDLLIGYADDEDAKLEEMIAK